MCRAPASALVTASVDFGAGYQQVSHRLVLFLRTAAGAENRLDASPPRAGERRPLDGVADPRRVRGAAGEVDFFPARGESTRDAKAVCAVCPVRRDCLEFALRLKVAHGVWGGLSERERRNLRRDRRRAATERSRRRGTVSTVTGAGRLNRVGSAPDDWCGSCPPRSVTESGFDVGPISHPTRGPGLCRGLPGLRAPEDAAAVAEDQQVDRARGDDERQRQRRRDATVAASAPRREPSAKRTLRGRRRWATTRTFLRAARRFRRRTGDEAVEKLPCRRRRSSRTAPPLGDGPCG